MKLFNPINGGADIVSPNFTFLKGTTLMVSDVPGLAIKKQWGFLQEVEMEFEAPVIEAPKAPVASSKVEKVSVELEENKVVAKPVKVAKKAVPVEKVGKKGRPFKK